MPGQRKEKYALRLFAPGGSVRSMPRVVREYKAQARARIVDAAQAVFRRGGFRTATMEDVAKEIGVSKGAIYLYFRSKSALLAAIQERMRERVLAHWEPLLDGGDVAEGIAESLDDVFTGDVDPGIWHELIADAAQDPELRAALEDDVREDLRGMREFLKRLEARGRIPKLRDRDTVAEIVLVLLHGTVVELMLHGRGAQARRTLVASLRYLLETDR